VLILALPFFVAALLWDKLPDRLPIHWNLSGEIDGYSAKPFGTLFLPIVNVALVALIGILPRFDPKCRSYEAETKASLARVFRIFRLAFSLFFSAMSLAMLSVALNSHLDMSRCVAGGLGVMLAVMGNSMGKLRPNYFAGFRTPWTRRSLTVWRKTHRLGGRLMVGGGLCILVESLVLPTWLCLGAVLASSLVIGLVPAAYSYFIFQTEKETSHGVS